jgi:Rieske 2Fe-2S family protein
METFEKAGVDGTVKTLAGEWYTSPAIFARERERIFAGSWNYVAREERVARAGDFALAEVAGESLIVTRDPSGRVRAFFNVCRHRGTRLCTEPAGRFAGSIRCPYHAWTYALDGSLTAARNMAEVPGFSRADYPLHEAPVALHDGFVFVNLAARPEPFERALGAVLARFARWNAGALRVVREIEYDLACNWKLVFQNYSECYHCPLVHPQLDALSPSDSGRNDLRAGAVLGGYSELRRGETRLTTSAGTSLTTTGTTARAALGELSGADLERVYYYTIFPSMLLSLHPDYVMVHSVQPVAVDRTRVVCAWLFDPAAIAAPGFDPSDAVDFWDLTNRQDWRVNELTQCGVSSRTYVPGPYAGQEGLLAAFDRHYLLAMAD